MIKIDIQFFGGRTSSSGMSGQQQASRREPTMTDNPEIAQALVSELGYDDLTEVIWTLNDIYRDGMNDATTAAEREDARHVGSLMRKIENGTATQRDLQEVYDMLYDDED